MANMVTKEEIVRSWSSNILHETLTREEMKEENIIPESISCLDGILKNVHS